MSNDESLTCNWVSCLQALSSIAVAAAADKYNTNMISRERLNSSSVARFWGALVQSFTSGPQLKQKIGVCQNEHMLGPRYGKMKSNIFGTFHD